MADQKEKPKYEVEKLIISENKKVYILKREGEPLEWIMLVKKEDRVTAGYGYAWKTRASYVADLDLDYWDFEVKTPEDFEKLAHIIMEEAYLWG